jgi:Ca2+-binding EF-hand superfamily protein
MMRKLTAILVLCLSCSWLALPVPARAEDTPAAADKPAELAKDVIDPYAPARERTRFLKNAGVDNELDAKEFTVTQGKKHAFAREWDSWEALKKYDKNNNGSIDWFEADAYRRAVRKDVLAALDANRDGRLKGDERDKLNRSLAAGKLPVKAAAANGDGRPPRRWGGIDDETRKKYDADNDGKLSRDEMREVWKDRKEAFVKKYDTDGDGQLNAEEKKAAGKAMMETVKSRLEQRMMRKYDKDNDGELNEEENAAYEAARKKVEERIAAWKKRAEERRAELIEKYDTDGDGELSEDEKRTARQAMRDKYVEKYDTDGDGKLSREERRAAWKERRQKRILRRYDEDGDGQLSEEEKAKYEAARKARRERIRKWRERMRGNRDDDDSSSGSAESSDGPITVTESDDGTATVTIGQ